MGKLPCLTSLLPIINLGKPYICGEQRPNMGKIIHLKESKQLTNELHQQNQKMVLVGGCFDILHIGHITFLEEAKKQGDMLLVLLESDETITQTKGPHRPINM